jgi:DNA-binding PadR family transcriptional regulator
MEYVVLGLLLIRPRTIYEINSQFKMNISLFYKASYGSLQIVVKKLAAKGYIDYKESTENGRHKKTYRITNTGTQAFFIWMREEIPINNLEVVGLSKLFFLGLLKDSDEREKVIGKIRAGLKETINELELVGKQIHSYPIPESAKAVFYYQAKTLDYGIWANKAALKWFNQLSSEIQQQLD